MNAANTSPKPDLAGAPLRIEAPATAEEMEPQARVFSVEADGAGPTVLRADAVF